MSVRRFGSNGRILPPDRVALEDPMMRDAILRGSANILVTISLVGLSASAFAQGRPRRFPRRRARACRACRFPRWRCACRQAVPWFKPRLPSHGGDTCLSDAQLAAVAKITSDYKPGFAVAGMDTFPRWPLFEGALFRERSKWSQVPQPSNPLSGKEPCSIPRETRRRSSSSAATEARHDDLRSEAVSVRIATVASITNQIRSISYMRAARC
jgi:hypothetical protein